MNPRETPETPEATVLDQRQSEVDAQADVAAGLDLPEPALSCKYLYDARGSRLFERICEQPEYYLTRTELAILREHVGAIAEALGPRCLLVEPGTGDGVKTRLLLEHLSDPAGYAPVEISHDALARATADLQAAFPDLEVVPVCGDFTGDVDLPEASGEVGRRAVYFPGSTLGNFGPDERASLLQRFATMAGAGGALLLGVDLQGDPAVHEAAYNDAAGVTAAFTENALAHVARDLGVDVDPSGFAHRARWDAAAGCVDTRLVSLREQTIGVGERTFSFAAGDTIRVERSYKFALDALGDELAAAGWGLERTWTDGDERFAVVLATR